MEIWAEKFNLPLPECNKCGTCCLCASPSKSYKELLKMAANGDKFARDFFSIFIPYKNLDETRKISKSIVDRTLKSCEEGKNKIPPEDLVFYRCRHYHHEKKCLIYEDRPQLCRDFPGSPFVVLNEKCAFYDWAQKCKQSYKNLEKELENLKNYKKELENLKSQQKYIELLSQIQKTDDEYKFILTAPSMSVVSPGCSWIKL
ncbi:MAG: YkgJ family cysteine cluster protein [Candidatus Aenigmarchaeota archaeon]|nr:YkgJ family cysteine cluster protein [Candidatus Aenigmarchaeota archaeon]